MGNCNQAQTRSQNEERRAAVERTGHNPDDIISGRRTSVPPDRYGQPAQGVRDNRGGGYQHLNPGGEVIMTIRMRFTGDRNAEIEEAIRRTKRGGPGSGETWHHGTYNRDTQQGELQLMPTAAHQAIGHHGGNAEANADQNPNSVSPTQRARLGYPQQALP